jgi:hypothetical protein
LPPSSVTACPASSKSAGTHERPAPVGTAVTQCQTCATVCGKLMPPAIS